MPVHRGVTGRCCVTAQAVAANMVDAEAETTAGKAVTATTESVQTKIENKTLSRLPFFQHF